MNIREKSEMIESEILSKYATLSKNSKGRKKKEKECDLRTTFQRDRDRIIHCKSFRRLKHKTQVFISPEGDHYRTRLTHTLEVAQIARSIARALRLNEELTEAISLGHDLGHTPFGHAGEAALNTISDNGFRHFEQSVRVVDVLEKSGNGLNLTYEVCDGILCHTKGDKAKTPEGRIVKLADRIAYINHDIDDAIRAGILKESDLPKEPIKILGNTRTKRINNLIKSVVENSNGINIKMNDDIAKSFEAIHNFMFDAIYLNPSAKFEEKKIPTLIENLYKYFKSNYIKLPIDIRNIADKEGIDRAVCDYIAGMTDHYAVYMFKNIFIPASWRI